MQSLIFLLVKISPRRHLSRFTGWWAKKSEPRWLVRPVMKWFAQRYQLRLEEAQKPFEEFESLDDMFTRELKPGIRPVEGDVVHPADSEVAQSGVVESGKILQAKGWTYSVENLIGDQQKASDLENGSFITYYLCPTDYHRVHSPIDGMLKRMRHIPGDLWPVNPMSVESVKNLFAINERVIFEIESAFGRVFVVMVGATNVGQISTSVGPQWVTNLGNQTAKEIRIDEPEPIQAGQELGIFHLGSTAIVLFPENAKIPLLEGGQQVLYGGAVRSSQPLRDEAN